MSGIYLPLVRPARHTRTQHHQHGLLITPTQSSRVYVGSVY